MAIAKTTTHVSEALSKLARQFQGLPAISGLVSVYSAQVQALEEVFFQLFVERELGRAVGAQLDRLGVLLGEPRKALNDASYRLRLVTRVRLNVSSGSIPDLIELIRVLIVTNGEALPRLILTENGDTTITIRADGPITNTAEIDSLLTRSRAAGVGSIFISDTSSTAFILGNAINTSGGAVDTVNGMGSVALPGDTSTTGGDFASALAT